MISIKYFWTTVSVHKMNRCNCIIGAEQKLFIDKKNMKFQRKQKIIALPCRSISISFFPKISIVTDCF